MSVAAAPTTDRLPPHRLQARLIELLGDEERQMKEALDLLLTQARRYRASDLHVEIYRGQLRLRYRVDGYFVDIATLPAALQEQLVSRVKVMAGLIVHRRDIPQEGRIRSGNTDFRVSIIPTVTGEKLAIRVFDTMGRVMDLDELGFAAESADRLRDLLLRLSGTILLTGPSGSGKTTTLYAALRRIHDRCGDHAAISTIEDPVEYDLGLFAQTQVSPRTELTFAKALIAILRQDPRVIMLGEIRDPETCEIAMRAGLTGHLVLSTIHSGTAAGVVTRLLDMGIEPYVVSSSLRAVVAQRLARRCCPSCREEYVPDPALTAVARSVEPGFDGPWTRGAGCDECLGSGYRGRAALTELLVVEEHIPGAFGEKAGTRHVEARAREAGFVPLLADGVRKAIQGTTTLEEIVRALGAEATA